MSPAILSDSTEALLGHLPPFLQEAVAIHGALEAIAQEIERVEGEVGNVRRNLHPHTAEDYLKIWENLLGLSVDPPDKTLTQRQATALAFMSTIAANGSGQAWEETMSRLIGSGWTYREYIGDPALLPTNLIANPSVETDLTGYVNDTATFTRAQASSTGLGATPYGLFVIQMYTGGGSWQEYTGHYDVAVGPGVYQFAGSYANTGNQHDSGYILGVQSGTGTVDVQPTRGAPGPVMTRQYGQVTMETSGTIRITLIENIYGAGSGWWDGLFLCKGTDAPDYFDGDTPGYEWTGTAHASTSRQLNIAEYTVEILLPYSSALSAPATLAVTPTSGGGTLAAGAWYYAVEARSAWGETIPVRGTATLAATGHMDLSWPAVPGAKDYKVFRGTADGQEFGLALVSETVVWRGDWNAGTYYNVNEGVNYNGVAYRRKVAGRTATAPSSDGSNWETVSRTYADTGGSTDTTRTTAVNTSAAPQTGEAEALARQITPAHLDLIFTYGKGFILNESRLSEEPL